MNNNPDYNQLVIQAQLGDKESVDSLARLVRGRLCAYVYRIILEKDSTEDVVQDSLIEMVKSLEKLERVDRFWPWLRAISSNIIRNRYYAKKQRKGISMSDATKPCWYQGDHNGSDTVLAEIISRELQQTVLGAIQALKQQHRMVLVMRCYEQMQYCEIAEVMGRTELGTRVLMSRAKKALRRKLLSKRFGGKFLLSALVLFGKMTAPSKAAAAEIAVKSSTVGAGAAAALVTTAVSKTAVLSVTTAAVLAVGTEMVARPWAEKAVSWSRQTTEAVRDKVTKALSPPSPVSSPGQQCWYYYPAGTDGPVTMRMAELAPDGKYSYCQWLQNAQGNYYFDKARNIICLNNHRKWHDDLRVWRLPTDRADFRKFLGNVEGTTDETEYVRAGENENAVLIIGTHQQAGGSNWQIIRHYNLLEEEYFRYDWPAAATVIDNRDQMHNRGWTYFTVSGRLGQEDISGKGLIPFVYESSKNNPPWLTISIGGRRQIIDTNNQACVLGGNSQPQVLYEGGTFFKGLLRPWMGLHTIDVIRRDAAEHGIRFETGYTAGAGKAEVALTDKETRLVYIIDLNNDIIESIRFWAGNNYLGELTFSYLQDIEDVGTGFPSPRIGKDVKGPPQGRLKLWLVRVAEGSLFD